MRLRIVLLVLAIGSLVLVSFMVPLAMLLRTFAADNAVNGATIRAQFMAPLVATLGRHDLRLAVTYANQRDPGEPLTIYFLPGGTRSGGRPGGERSGGARLGAPAPWSAGVRLAASGRSLTEQAGGGVAIFVAVQGLRNGAAVIRAFVPDSALQRGVTKAWLVLGAVAAGLLLLAVGLASQLTRSLVRPLRSTAAVAEQLAGGDLSARATVTGPPEIRQVSDGLNRLAVRIGELLAHERETLADLSHRLRTPLTALRIDAEMLTGDKEIMARVVADVDALTRTVNEVIARARRPSDADAHAASDATAIVRERAAYWRALAEDQDRWMTVEIPALPIPVRVPPDDLAACVDILLENVFAHTPEGTAFSVRLSPRAAGGAWLAVSDHGPGFSLPDPAGRGRSGGGSTGLGLDIARRIAENSGGTLTIGRSPDGGGAVMIGLGPAAPPARRPHRRARTARLPVAGWPAARRRRASGVGVAGRAGPAGGPAGHARADRVPAGRAPADGVPAGRVPGRRPSDGHPCASHPAAGTAALPLWPDQGGDGAPPWTDDRWPTAPMARPGHGSPAGHWCPPERGSLAAFDAGPRAAGGTAGSTGDDRPDPWTDPWRWSSPGTTAGPGD